MPNFNLGVGCWSDMLSQHSYLISCSSIIDFGCGCSSLCCDCIYLFFPSIQDNFTKGLSCHKPNRPACFDVCGWQQPFLSSSWLPWSVGWLRTASQSSLDLSYLDFSPWKTDLLTLCHWCHTNTSRCRCYQFEVSQGQLRCPSFPSVWQSQSKLPLHIVLPWRSLIFWKIEDTFEGSHPQWLWYIQHHQKWKCLFETEVWPSPSNLLPGSCKDSFIDPEHCRLSCNLWNSKMWNLVSMFTWHGMGLPMTACLSSYLNLAWTLVKIH